jgi:AcrR family transcriptional regulator
VNQKKRVPSQSRGLERYDSILDAYSTLICERSDIHIPIQAIAQAAGASVGSLYHFFGGREAILDALAQRHVDRIAMILQSLEAVNTAEWKDSNPASVIEKLIGPTLDYFSRHRDVYIIAMTLPNRSEFSELGIPAQILQLHQKVLRIRCPLFTQDQIELHSKVIFKLPSGLIEVFSAHPDPRLLEQAKIACSAYLAEISKV